MKEDLYKKLLLISGSILLLIFVLAPFIWMLWVSFVPRPDIIYNAGTDYTIQNYINVLTTPTLYFKSYFFVRRLTISVCPLLAAKVRAVSPSMSRRLRLAPCSSKVRTTSS